MSAERTGLRKYATDSGFAYATRIKEIVPFSAAGPNSGAKTLTFSDSKKQVNLIREWLDANQPMVGGYFVVEDINGNTVCRHVDAATFAKKFKPI